MWASFSGQVTATANWSFGKNVFAYYNASEALFEEIEDYNENLFDTDKAVDYYNARLPISK